VVESGGPELADELERHGYERFSAEAKPTIGTAAV
jgi:Fe-S cluster assembly ATPase SufC